MKISRDKPGHTEQSQWEALVESTFDRPAPKAPVVNKRTAEQQKKTAFRRKKWFWAVLAALILVIAAVCIVPSFLKADKDAAIPNELLVCKEALDQWQELDSYKITGTFYRYGYSKSATQWNEQYWVSGEDWVLFNSAYKQSIYSSVIPPAGYMYRDGNYYITYSDTDPMWTLYDTDREDNRLELWPMTFSWDSCELIYLGTTQEDYATTVRFAAIDRSNEEETSVYNIEFQITSSGKLNNVAVVQTRDNGIITKDVYILSSSDADAMAEYIASQQVVEITDAVIVTPEAEND